MAKFITQTEYVNNVATNFEEKLATQYSRILQSAPTPVTYYHINIKASALFRYKIKS